MIISLEQAMAVQLWIAEGVTCGADELSERHAVDTELEILETHCGTLSEFGREGLRPADEDITASVLLSFHGRLSGATLFTMEPEDALAWARADGSEGDPVATYLDLAREVLSSVIISASAALGVETEIGRPKLVERTLGGCLLSTHAPSDTVLTSSRLRLQAGRMYYDASLHLLMEPKVMGAMLGALNIASN